jgi:hypothetical protein
MDLVFGKCAQTGLLGFLIGGGFPLWQHLADRARAMGAPPGRSPPAAAAAAAAVPPPGRSPPPAAAAAAASVPPPALAPPLLREALHEGLRTSRILVAATAASGTASFLQHGRYSERLFRLRGDPLSTFGGVFAAVFFFTDNNNPPAAAAGPKAPVPMQSLVVAGGPAHRLGSAFIIACIAGAVSGAMGR